MRRALAPAASAWRRRLARIGHPPAPFVVGSPRSGTTLLRLMLDAHGELAMLPETHFVPDLLEAAAAGSRGEELARVIVAHRRWGDFHLDQDELRERLRGSDARRALRAFFALYAERQGKPRWGDKTPEYALHMRRIEAVLPEARFIHVIRDGRDAALSRIRWRVERTGEPPPIERLARRWRRWIERARRQGGRVDHYMEVRYEDLIATTEPALRRVCSFLGLPWDPALLSYHERAAARLGEIAQELPADGGRRSLGADERLSKHAMTTKPPSAERIAVWRAEMNAADVRRFEAVAGELLAELGYPVGEPAAR